MQDAVTSTYSTYGCMFNPGQVAPAGEAFRNPLVVVGTIGQYVNNSSLHHNREVKILYGEEVFQSLYVPGDHHPTLKGSYLSACAHYSTLFGRPCEGNGYDAGLDAATALEMQIAADTVVSRGGWSYPADTDCELTMCQN